MSGSLGASGRCKNSCSQSSLDLLPLQALIGSSISDRHMRIALCRFATRRLPCQGMSWAGLFPDPTHLPQHRLGLAVRGTLHREGKR